MQMILIRYMIPHPTIYNRYDWGWKVPDGEETEEVAHVYNGQHCGHFWDEYTTSLCDLMLHG